MEEDLQHLSSWLCLNSMKLNVSKSKLLLFNEEGLMPHVDLCIDGEAIENICEFKFLGIWLDATLSFSEHYTAVHDRLLKSSFMIGSLCRSLPSDCMRQLYFAYYDLHLSYGVLIWYPMLLKWQQDALYMMQKRIIQCINRSSPCSHCMPLFKKDKILTVADGVLLENCKLMYKV